MPRTPVVTREMTVTKAVCYVVDLTPQGPKPKEMPLYCGRVYKTSEALLESLSSTYETDTFKVVRVKSFGPKKVRVVQAAETFIAHAEIEEIEEQEEKA